MALNIKVTQQEMLKRLRGEATVLNGRGMTAPAEVGFSVEELTRAVVVIEDLVKWVSSSPDTIIKKLQWQRNHFTDDIKALKELIKETTAVLLLVADAFYAAKGRGRGRGKGSGRGRGSRAAGGLLSGRGSGAARG